MHEWGLTWKKHSLPSFFWTHQQHCVCDTKNGSLKSLKMKKFVLLKQTEYIFCHNNSYLQFNVQVKVSMWLSAHYQSMINSVSHTNSIDVPWNRSFGKHLPGWRYKEALFAVMSSGCCSFLLSCTIFTVVDGSEIVLVLTLLTGLLTCLHKNGPLLFHFSLISVGLPGLVAFQLFRLLIGQCGFEVRSHVGDFWFHMLLTMLNSMFLCFYMERDLFKSACCLCGAGLSLSVSAASASSGSFWCYPGLLFDLVL